MAVPDEIRIYNCSRQMISLQVRPPGTEFYTNENQVRLAPGKDALLPKNHLMMDQIENLCKRGFLKVVFDSNSQA